MSGSRAIARPPRPARPPRRPGPAESLTQQAVEELRRLIVANTLAPGSILNETHLVERLGISRTPVREALKLLAADGLVLLRRNRAAMVAPLDGGELSHLFEVETAIESFAAGLAAARRSEADIRRLERLQDRMEQAEAAGQRDAYVRTNMQVHAQIVACSGNPALAETHERLIGRLQRARNLALAQQGRVEESIREHREILEALRRKDADAAAALMGRHVARTGEIVAAICRGVLAAGRSRGEP